jgi:hypothetical protein
MNAPTATPWQVVKSFNGFVVTRSWSSGFYQRMKASFQTEADAIATAAKENKKTC